MPTTRRGAAEVHPVNTGSIPNPVHLLKKPQQRAFEALERLRKAVVEYRSTLTEEEILAATAVVSAYVAARDDLKENPRDIL